jgi:uncharacterized protein (DUF305 family)
MNTRAKRIALGAFAVALAALAALARLAEFPVHAQTPMAAAHRQTGAIAPSSSAAEPTFYSEMTKVNARMHEAMEIVPSGNIERDFMQMMIPHHQGAIDMALVLLQHGRDERLKRLAQSIIVEQGQEIAYMRALLDARPAEVSTSHSRH